MSNYLVKRDSTTGKIIYMEYDLEGYSFKPKNKSDKPYINVSNVTIYEREMIDNLLARKFQKKFDRLSQIIMNFLFQEDSDNDSDNDEGDFMILLDEVARLKSIVELKYQKFLSNQEYKDYIHKLDFLDTQLRQKIAMVSYKRNLEYQVEQGRSR